MAWFNPFADRQTARQRSGQAAEDEALAHLSQQGLTLVERNFRCKGGEIDLVMEDGATLVFVEVRQRSSMAFGGAAASVTPAKQARMIRAAQFFLLRYPAQPACRFDVVAIDGGPKEGSRLSWLKNVI
ncbi:MAG: YraN family protein [Burkholderiaceae bacterium]|nr:YraN family protein [Burkholderiaceae bacterium]